MKTLTTKEELGLVAKDVFYEAGDDEAYKPVTIKINEELKTFLEQTNGRHGVDKEFLIPSNATLNNLHVVRLEDIKPKSNY